MRRYAPLLPCLLLPCLSLLFACGGDDTDDGEPAGEPDARRDTALVDWMDEACGAVAQSIQALPFPMPAPGATTEADRPPLLDYLAEARTALDASIEAADALPRPPSAAARDLAERYRADLDQLAAELREYEVNATTFPAAGLDSIYTLVGVTIVEFRPGGDEMSEYLEGHADLTEAHGEAPTCSGEGATTTDSGPSTTAGTPEEREAALRADIEESFADQPGGDQQVLDLAYAICASLDATDPDRYYPPENMDPARASSLVETVAGLSRVEVLESFGRIEGNPVTVGVVARLAARHVCPEHSEAVEDFMSNL